MRLHDDQVNQCHACIFIHYVRFRVSEKHARHGGQIRVDWPIVAKIREFLQFFLCVLNLNAYGNKRRRRVLVEKENLVIAEFIFVPKIVKRTFVRTWLISLSNNFLVGN